MLDNINFHKNSPFSFIEYGFYTYYATIFLMVWIHPEQYNVSLINDLAVLIAFEFIMVHSGVFMAVMPKRYSIFVFFPMYGLFAYSFNNSVIDTNIFYIYLLVVLNRMRFAFSNVSSEVRVNEIAKSVFRVILYCVLLVIVGLGNEFVPKLGLTPEFLEKVHYLDKIKSSGLIMERPYIAMCMGFLYYSLPVLFFLFRIIKRTHNSYFIKERVIRRYS
jgi:hypothetical protein